MRREEFYDEDDAIQIKKKKRPANEIQTVRSNRPSVNTASSRNINSAGNTQYYRRVNNVATVTGRTGGTAVNMQNRTQVGSTADVKVKTAGSSSTARPITAGPSGERYSNRTSENNNGRNIQRDSERNITGISKRNPERNSQVNTERKTAQSISAGTRTPSGSLRGVAYAQTKENNFKKPYFIFLSLLVILSLIILGFVYFSLVDYEKSQPDNMLLSEISEIKKYAEKGKIEEVISLTTYRNTYSLTDEQVREFENNFVADEITVKESLDNTDPEIKNFDVLEDGYKIATAKLKHLSQETKLIIFTLDRWELETFTVTGYDIEFTVPSSIIVKNNGNDVYGETSDDGRKTSYAITSLVKPNIEICDLLGNSEPYTQTNVPTITEYKIKLPSDYTIVGEKVVPVEAAKLEPIKEFEYARDYVKDIPDNATYTLGVLTDTFDAKILDGKGNVVDYELNGHKIEIGNDVSYSTELPESIKNEIDPIEPVKLWSLLMTNDLTGANHGYGQVKQYLIEGSYLEETAKKWALGVDITFTSIHSLENPVFSVAEASNFKVYSDNFFSCDITLTKKMIFLDRTTADDTIHSTFYYVKYDDTNNGIDDPHWAIVDYRTIGE